MGVDETKTITPTTPPSLPEPLLRLYIASHMAEVTHHAVVWIGVVGVAPKTDASC